MFSIVTFFSCSKDNMKPKNVWYVDDVEYTADSISHDANFLTCFSGSNWIQLAYSNLPTSTSTDTVSAWLHPGTVAIYVRHGDASYGSRDTPLVVVKTNGSNFEIPRLRLWKNSSTVDVSVTVSGTLSKN